jgi:hypothetical protein
VQVDPERGHILALGGNVRGVVSLKVLPASRGTAGILRPDPISDERPLFAHLTLRAPAIEADALDTSRTVRAAGCTLLLDPAWAGRRGTACAEPRAGHTPR